MSFQDARTVLDVRAVATAANVSIWRPRAAPRVQLAPVLQHPASESHSLSEQLSIFPP